MWISLSLKIAGIIWDYVITQLNKIYNRSSVFFLNILGQKCYILPFNQFLIRKIPRLPYLVPQESFGDKKCTEIRTADVDENVHDIPSIMFFFRRQRYGGASVNKPFCTCPVIHIAGNTLA